MPGGLGVRGEACTALATVRLLIRYPFRLPWLTVRCRIVHRPQGQPGQSEAKAVTSVIMESTIVEIIRSSGSSRFNINLLVFDWGDWDFGGFAKW